MEIVSVKKFQGRNFSYEELILSKVFQEAHIQMQALALRFKLHPLTVEDCLHRNQRVKIESFSEYQFIVWYYFHQSIPEPIELHIILGKDFMLLISDDLPRHMADSWKTLCFPQGQSIYLFDAICQMFETLNHHTEFYVNAVEYSLAKLEKKIMNQYVKPTQILRFKYLVWELDQTVCLAGIIFHNLDKLSFSTDQRFKWRNVIDNHSRLLENINHVRHKSLVTVDIYYGSAGAHTNKIIKKLTLLSAYILPMTFWTGFFGMNFEGMPYKSENFFYFGLAVIFGIPLLSLTWFSLLKYLKYKKKRLAKLRSASRKKRFPFLYRKLEYSRERKFFEPREEKKDEGLKW